MTRFIHSRHAVFFFTAIFTLTFVGAISLRADDGSPPPWKAPSRASRKKNPNPADANSIAAGKVIYEQQCLTCHGVAGKGDGPKAREPTVKPGDLSSPAVAAETDGALYWKITTGRTPMPKFEKLISDDDRWNVVNYIRTLGPPPSSQPSEGANP